MKPEDQFERVLVACLNQIEEAGAVTCRAESIEVVEKAVRALGLADAVTAHISAAYGAESLSDLSEDNLKSALRFVSALAEHPPVRQIIPLQPGMTADGNWCLFSGRLSWNGGGR